MTTYAVQVLPFPAIVLTTNSRITAQRFARDVQVSAEGRSKPSGARSAYVIWIDEWGRPWGGVQYNHGRRVDGSFVSSVACTYQQHLANRHGLVQLPHRDPSAAKTWDAGIEREYLGQHERVTRERQKTCTNN